MTSTENDAIPAPRAEAPIAAQRTVVEAPPDSRLEALCAEWAALKPQVDEMTARLKTLSDGIKAETAAAAPTGCTDMVLRSSALPSAYRVHAVESMRLDTTALKNEQPLLYASFAKKSVSWRLDAVK